MREEQTIENTNTWDNSTKLEWILDWDKILKSLNLSSMPEPQITFPVV